MTGIHVMRDRLEITLAATLFLLITGCGVFSTDGEDGSPFRTLDAITLEFDKTSDGSTDLRLRITSAEGADSLVVRDSLRLVSDARYRVTLVGSSSEVQAYLSSRGPSGTLTFRMSPSLKDILEFASVFGSIPVNPLSGGSTSAKKSNSETVESTSQSGDAAVPFAFELTTADTGTTDGSLRLRLERYRSERVGEPEHIDFDVVVPTRVTEE